MAETPQEAFDRGRDSGRFEARLDEHDNNFKKLNGTLDKINRELHGIFLSIQQINDKDDARDNTTVVTAAALKQATEQAWAPWTRVAAVLGGLGVLLSLILSVYLAFRHNTITQLPVKKK